MRLFVLILLLSSSQGIACPGPMSESAQESDASIIVVAKPTGYEFGSSKEKARVSLKVLKTVKGSSKDHWIAVMRGRSLPKNLQDFIKRFGSKVRIGLRFFSKKNHQESFPKDYRSLPFIVDATCSMNGEDWLIKRIR